MAKGLKLTLDATVNNSSLPIARVDKRLTAGSLLLIDFSHPLSSTASIPATGDTIKNLAYIEAMSLLSTTEVNVSPTVNNTITGGKGLMEFTTKKGLHGIITQVSDVTGGNDFKISLPTAMKTYIFNNITRNFFVSIWTNYTRLATNTQNNIDLTMFFSNTSNYSGMVKPSGIYPSNTGSYRFSSINTTSPRIANTVINGFAGSPVVGHSFEFIFGTLSGIATVNTAPSTILYQMHVIDLTTAGLTYAQADALDLAAFNSAFGVGGRFENDTFTSPSTLP